MFEFNFHKKGSNLKRLDEEVFDLYCRLNGAYTHEKELFIPSEQNVREALKEIDELRVKDRSIKQSPENRIWLQHLKDLLDGMEIKLREFNRYPGRYSWELVNAIYRILEEPRKYQIKARILTSKLSTIDIYFQAKKQLCVTASNRQIDRAILYANSLLSAADYGIKTIQSWLKKRKNGKPELRKACEKAIDSLTNLKKNAKHFANEVENVKRRPKRKILEDLPYAEVVEKRHGLHLKWILSWYQKDLEEIKKKVEELAARIDPTKKPIEIFEEYSPAYPTSEEMFAAMKEFLAIARENSKRYIDLPKGESCKVEGVTEVMSHLAPFGNSEGPDPVKGRLKGKVQLNQYNVRGLYRAWLELMAIHECYPGHTLNDAKISVAKLPKTFKIRGGKDIPLTEGLAHRSEVLLRHIYDDEVFPLFVAYRRLHTILRVYVDVSLHYSKTLTPEKAVNVYMEEMGWDEKTARVQVAHHLEDIGYPLCYYSGCKLLNEMRDKTRKTMSEKEFNNELFSAGYISMKCVKMLLEP